MLLLFVLEQRDTRSDSFSASSKKQPLNGKNTAFVHCPGKHHNDNGQIRLLESFLSLPGGSREAQGVPKSRQECPKTTLGALEGAIRASQRRVWGGWCAHLWRSWPPRGPRRPPGGHLGPRRRRFWTLRGSFLGRPEVHFGDDWTSSLLIFCSGN